MVIFLKVRDAGNLLTRAGFTLPGVDVDEYVVKYQSGKHSLFVALAYIYTSPDAFDKFLN